ncbi:hypothetical protein FRACYDRAFT_236063 [Fragilariopsis cylindrus CCMP1102]|uniref:Uncharacterized protein n=1 Tax=Fragilariopsis cylindrus CCMP1102 TaxID=635003 RepID=A0A1E7FPC1_9STRA|nr:hypothetical protein FRACYDRAFT_236063 [Fragilariopsis cylindrus CCMP1102]|eukprot:OEU20001.1 hypothetical protein FRACYDRAFT_236063 [Fragilariopsis cylindrus CCMP1102]
MTNKNISLLFLALFGIIVIASASTSGLRGAAAAAGDLVEEDYDPEDFQDKEFVLIEDYNLEDMVDEEDRTLFNGKHGGNNNWYNNRKYNNNRYNGNNNNNNNLSGNNQFNNNGYNYNNIPNRRRDNDDDFDFCNFAYGCYGDGGLQNYHYGGGYGRGYHGRKKGYGGGW